MGRNTEIMIYAVKSKNGTKEWWVNGILHRDNGLPALEYFNGYKEWWVNGEFMIVNKFSK
jgi:hypothetical protein